METNSNGRLDRFIQYVSREQHLVGASAFRVLAGLMVIYEYLINYVQRRYLFGPDGVWPFEYFFENVHRSGSFSLFAFSSSPVWFEGVFHVGLLIAVLWMLGYRTRWLTPLNYVFFWSLHERNPNLWDGGDNLVQLAMVYMMFANVGAYFSVRPSPRREARWLPAVLHNAAMLMLAIQVSLVYGIAGLTKVQGEVWQNGTAIYYSLQASQFFMHGVSDRIYSSAVIVAILTYATVAFQVAFPFLLFMGNRWTRLLAVGAGLMFHLGIGAVMGLVTFAGFLIAADLALISDEEYLWFGKQLARVANRFRRARPAELGTGRAAA